MLNSAQFFFFFLPNLNQGIPYIFFKVVRNECLSNKHLYEELTVGQLVWRDSDGLPWSNVSDSKVTKHTVFGRLPKCILQSALTQASVCYGSSLSTLWRTQSAVTKHSCPGNMYCIFFFSIFQIYADAKSLQCSQPKVHLWQPQLLMLSDVSTETPSQQQSGA